MTSPYLVKGILLKDIIDTGGNDNNFNNYYQNNNSSPINTTITNYSSMRPLLLGYQIGGHDFQNQCLAQYSFITTGSSIEVPKAYNPINNNNVRAKNYRSIMVGGCGGQGGKGGGAAVKVEAVKTVKANGGVGGYGGYGVFDTKTYENINNNSFNYILGTAGNTGNNGKKNLSILIVEPLQKQREVVVDQVIMEIVLIYLMV